jgi:hypothetical protein
MEENQSPIYFTKEIDEQVRNMTDEDMFKLLYNLEQSEFWIAILRYNQIRSSYTQSVVLSADPVKDPTLIARNQGIMLGLADLQNAVIMLWQEKQKVQQSAEQNSTDVE